MNNELLDAWDSLNVALARMLNALPHQMTAAAELVESNRESFGRLLRREAQSLPGQGLTATAHLNVTEAGQSIGSQSSIVDLDGLPQSIRAVIEAKDRLKPLQDMYALIQAWGDARVVAAKVEAAAGREA